MTDQLASVSIASELHGHGMLRCNEFSCEVAFTLSRDKYAHSQSWQFRAVPLDPKASLHSLYDAGDPNDPVSLTGRVDNGWRGIEIPRLTWPSVYNNVLLSPVWSFELTEGNHDIAVTEWWASVYLTENPLALPEVGWRVRDPRGRHEMRGEVREPVRWETTLGQFEFSRQFAFEEVSVGGVHAELEIPHPALWIQITGRENDPASALLDTIEEELSVFLRLVGLLGRKRTVWTRISVTTRSSDGTAWSTTTRYREAGDRSTPKYLEDLC